MAEYNSLRRNAEFGLVNEGLKSGKPG